MGASAGLLVASSDEKIKGPTQLDVLDMLAARDELQFVPMIHSDQALVEALVDIAAEAVRLLDDGSDYLRIGSAWQQRLSSEVKGSAFVTFLCCSIINDEIADIEVLVTWFEDALADSLQMSDETLANVILKSMAVLAKSSPATASNLSKMLPRVIVQGGLDSRTVAVASESLSSILKLLTQDAVISTLYSLGNVLTAGATDRASYLPAVDGNTQNKSSSNGTTNHDAAGSAISLTPGDTDESSTSVYAGVIQTIVGVAISCNDDKITALAQSMLIQKMGRVNSSVDAMIITETGLLGVHIAPGELRTLLKFYARACHEALVGGHRATLEAVSFTSVF